MKLEYSLIPYTTINSKWFKDLKLLEENTDKIFSNINCNNVFLGQSPKAIKIKTKINKWANLQVLHSKGDYEQNEKTTYILGENICKLCDWQGLSFQNIQTQQNKTQSKNGQKT